MLGTRSTANVVNNGDQRNEQNEKKGSICKPLIRRRIDAVTPKTSLVVAVNHSVTNRREEDKTVPELIVESLNLTPK